MGILNKLPSFLQLKKSKQIVKEFDLEAQDFVMVDIEEDEGNQKGSLKTQGFGEVKFIKYPISTFKKAISGFNPNILQKATPICSPLFTVGRFVAPATAANISFAATLPYLTRLGSFSPSKPTQAEKASDLEAQYVVVNIENGEEVSARFIPGKLSTSEKNLSQLTKDREIIEVEKEVNFYGFKIAESTVYCLNSAMSSISILQKAKTIGLTGCAFYASPVLMANVTLGVAAAGTIEYFINGNTKYTNAFVGAGVILGGLGVGVPVPYLLAPISVAGSAYIFGGAKALEYALPVVNFLKSPACFVSLTAFSFALVASENVSKWVKEAIVTTISEELYNAMTLAKQEIAAQTANIDFCGLPVGKWVNYVAYSAMDSASVKVLESGSKVVSGTVDFAMQGSKNIMLNYCSKMGENYLQNICSIPQEILSQISKGLFTESVQEVKKPMNCSL